ncbi:MAG: hypothetical protein JWQ04_426 [Pedosphaera sp.]|nr:hypothetical protein [Pedosphaera sp.]
MTTHNKTKHLPANSGSNRALNMALATTCLFSSAAVPLIAADAPPPSKVNALVNIEFANEYLTPRGLIVVNQGLTAQPLVLGFVNVYKGDSFINDVTFVPGVWADFSTSQQGSHDGFNFTTRAGGQGPEHGILNEIDPIFGVTTTFAKNCTLGLTYTAFISQEGQYPTSQHLETKFSFNDSDCLKAYALHPTVIYWQELQNKATVGPIAGHGPSGYFDIGIAPSYTFESCSVKVELPVRTLIPIDNRFYGRSGIGLYEVGAKASVPMKFMPAGYGSWSFHLGVKYMKFLNGDKTSGLIGMNSSGFLAPGPGSYVTDTVQVYAGVSTFF